MSKTISLEQLPRQVESLLREAWEGHDSVVLESDGEPVAVVVLIEDYLRLHPESNKSETAEMPSALDYELPADLLDAYHRLLDKKFTSGLTPDEEAELAKIDKQLDEAELATPLIQSTLTKTGKQHERWMHTLNDVITKLRELRESP